MNELILSASLYMSTCRPIRKWMCNRDMMEESIMLEYPHNKRITSFLKVSHQSRYGSGGDRGTEQVGIGVKILVKKWRF